MTEERDNDSDVDVFEESSLAKPHEPNPSWAELPSADMLSIDAADELLRSRPANLITIIGERNGGKTTLITEIYEQFMRGPFAAHMFCQSRSLLGFEKKTFQSRAMSGSATPDTPRTSVQEGLQFFHLALTDETNLKRTDLLISERAGELYREVRDRPETAHQLIEVIKAHTISFILDGERVSDSRRRAEAFASVRNIARALADAGAIRQNTEIQLVTTKRDLLEGENAAAARKALDEFEAQFAQGQADRFINASIFRIAARDPKGIVEPVSGVAQLLDSWTRQPAMSAPPIESTPALVDEFDRLVYRRIA